MQLRSEVLVLFYIHYNLKVVNSKVVSAHICNHNNLGDVSAHIVISNDIQYCVLEDALVMVGMCALEDIFASTELSLYVLVHYMTNTGKNTVLMYTEKI